MCEETCEGTPDKFPCAIKALVSKHQDHLKVTAFPPTPDSIMFNFNCIISKGGCDLRRRGTLVGEVEKKMSNDSGSSD